MIQFRNIADQAIYETSRYDVILRLEETSVPKPSAG